MYVAVILYIFTFYIQAKGVVKIWKEVTDTADKQLGILLSGSWYFLGKFITDHLLRHGTSSAPQDSRVLYIVLVAAIQPAHWLPNSQ